VSSAFAEARLAAALTAPPQAQPAALPWLQSASVRSRLEALESQLLLRASAEDPQISDICVHLVRAGGKRLRPALLLLSAEFGVAGAPGVFEGATAVELLHVATLYHDDIIDEAGSRRGCPSVNRLWGNRAAVFAGTYLFSKATETFAALGAEISRAVSHAVGEVWYGQAQEMESVFDLDVNEQIRLGIVEKKTAALCELPCRLGALLGGLSERRSQALAHYGHDLGVAFQITDDILDITAEEETIGKCPGTDLRQGVYTLPVLFCLQEEDTRQGRLRRLLRRRPLEQHHVAEALALIRRSNAIERTIAVAQQHVTRALGRLEQLPGGHAKNSLAGLALSVANRVQSRGIQWP
jgi:heptaprenyl diphosphate synthase